MNTTGRKFGGRKAGVTNHITKDLRDIIQSFIENNIEDMQANYEELPPKEKLLFLEKLLSYTLPKMQSIQVTQKDDELKRQTQIALDRFCESIK